jgi:purine-binding chemotaxis protein CheW
MTEDRILCFTLGTEAFGIPLESVKEVLGLPEITPVPFAGNHLVGIMNLRGQVISLIDLRAKFGIKSNQSSETSVVICDLENTSIGIIVDSIDSVISPSPEELSPKPQLQGSASSDYINAVYRKDGKMILFLDIASTLSMGERGATGKKSIADKTGRAA